MKTFDEIYILDLHGNSLKKERTSDGGKDENVFDIRQGVAIALFVKLEGENACRTYHVDLYGLRKRKYDWLENHDVKNARYEEIEPKSPWYFFIPRNIATIEYYLDWPSIIDIFPVNITGIKTHRDSFVIGFSTVDVKNRMMQFMDLSLPDEFIRNAYKLKDTASWKLPEARRALSNDDNWGTCFQKILYRPFDIRDIYYTPTMIDRGRESVMRHMIRENISLCFMRQVSLEGEYDHFLTSKYMVDNRTFLSSKGTIQQAPLYLYPDTGHRNLFSDLEATKGRTPNIREKVFSALSEAYKTKPSPEDIFYYIYSVLYSNTYREKYAEFLKTDFPRIPFTKDECLFKKLAEYGKRLADLHLMQSPDLESPVVKFQGAGDKRVDNIKYDEKSTRVYINKEQYFEGLEEDVWQYRIGGYQVCDKWLKDRKGRVLSLDDTKHYCRVATAIEHTIGIQKSIDEIYNEAEKELVKIHFISNVQH